MMLGVSQNLYMLSIIDRLSNEANKEIMMLIDSLHGLIQSKKKFAPRKLKYTPKELKIVNRIENYKLINSIKLLCNRILLPHNKCQKTSSHKV